MTRPSCEQSHRVEPFRDGRLSPEESAVFAKHLETCVQCRAEQRALHVLARDLRQIGEHVDEMALRRLRTQTLEHASALMQAKSSPTRRALVGFALAACAIVAIARWPRSPTTETETRTETTTPIFVEAKDNARWHRARERDVERVILSEGTLTFRVARKASDPRLLVLVPDGEIEDLGTIFSVTVEAGQTRDITVREGRVLFRRQGAAALPLAAGTSWQRTVEVVSPAVEPPALVPPATTTAPREAAPKMKKHKPAAPAAAERAAKPLDVPDEAEGREDSAYLHILALLREGRRDEARLAAYAYLRAFPDGFRRVEVRRVAELAEGDAGSSSN